jgi:glycosyltransferase involved in cell wall biosynthesis
MIWHTHNFLNLQRNLSLRGRFNCWQVRRGADWLLCVSQAVADGWGRSGVPTRVVHNCVGSRYLALPPVPPLTSRPAGAPLRLVGSGRMEWWKGHHVSIAAVAHLHAAGLPVTLDLFGGPVDGNPYLESLRTQIAKRGLERVVTFRGYVGDFVHRLGDYDVALQSRIDPEPCGLYVLECLNRELPIVASSGGGTPELLRDNREGYLYPAGDALALARCIERLARDPAHAVAMAQAGRARVQAEFSPGRFARNMAAFYAEVLAAAPAGRRAAIELGPASEAFEELQAG